MASRNLNLLSIGMLAGLLACVVAGCARDEEPPPDEDLDSRWPACDPDATEQLLSFIHVNDIHATYTPEPEYGYVSPVSRMRGYYESVKADHNPYTLFSDGGDDHEKGSIAELLSHGQSTVEVVEALRFDVRVIGNHDFAWSEEELLRFSRDPQAIVLASNTEYVGTDPDLWGAVEYAELQVGCVRLGLFGFVSQPWTECDTMTSGDFFPDGSLHTTYDWAQLGQQIVADHAHDVDLMVFVSHIGAAMDGMLAEAIPEIDIILGGHSHTAIQTPVEAGNALIIQAGTNSEWIAHLDVTLDLDSREIIGHEYELLLNVEANEELSVDQPTQDAVEQIMATYAPDALVEVAWVKDGGGEDTIAQITAGAALAVFDEADVALMDPGNVWHSWSEGPLTQQDLLDTYKVQRQPSGSPGFNAVYLVDLSGADLEEVLATAPSDWKVEGLESFEPAENYTLAIQKCAAFNPADFFGSTVSFANLREGLEAWDVLYRYGQQRTAAGLYIDVDEPMPG